MSETNTATKIQKVAPLECLLADDDPLIRLCLETIIRGAGHRVTSAADGAAAVEILGDRKFDVVISDIRMPRLDGWGVLRCVRQSFPKTDVILMTAYATVPDAIEALGLGAFDYLPKPVDAEELESQLEAISKRRTSPNRAA